MQASAANPILFLLGVTGAIAALIVIACVGWAMISRDDRGAPPRHHG